MKIQAYMLFLYVWSKILSSSLFLLLLIYLVKNVFFIPEFDIQIDIRVISWDFSIKRCSYSQDKKKLIRQVLLTKKINNKDNK